MGHQMIMKASFALLLLCMLTGTGHAASPRVQDVVFESHGDALSGSIALPVDRPIHAAVVFIHGSGKQTRNLALAERFANEGIAALVYDKRGAGKSGGVYEAEQNVSGKNIALLADDAAAALDALAKLPALKGVPAGFAGISQAGWIAPVAAQRSKAAKFLVLWSGPVGKVSEEDIYSKHTADRDSGTLPTFADAVAARKDPYIWPDFLGRDTDSAEDLGKLSIPGLWLFSDNDGSIPVALSIEKLRALESAGHAYDYALFSGLGHDNIDRTFATVIDWIERLPKP
jgi:pimeloyl-ACP methyl ester carboxylesterase